MKNINKLTFCAIIAALAVVFMLLSYFPYLTYAIPALSGLFIMVTVIEINAKWATLAYVTAAAVLIISPADIESKALFICFFGFYPILKALIERLRKPFFEWPLKILIFNIALALIYIAFTKLTSVSLDDFGVLGEYGAVVLLGLGNITFIVYDIAVSRVAMFYMFKLHNKIKKLLGN